MKFDTIIIGGGGLSGLSAGISLVKAGQRVAVVSAGQSSLHFNSGSFELMGYDENHRPVENPLRGHERTRRGTSYRRMGLDNVARLAPQVAPMLADAGVRMRGTAARNHWRLSPMGVMKTAWLTVEDHIALDSPDSFPWKKAAIINITGLLDFFPRFPRDRTPQARNGISLAEVTCNEIAKQRGERHRIRATNIAKGTTRQSPRGRWQPRFARPGRCGGDFLPLRGRTRKHEKRRHTARTRRTSVLLHPDNEHQRIGSEDAR